jgi:hypothetical protein
MYVWERLHVKGREITSGARRRKNFKDSYPNYPLKQFYKVNFETF